MWPGAIGWQGEAMEDEVLWSVDAGVATVTLNRPQKMNALTPAMMGALRDGMRELGGDRAVRAIILTGAGRCFCAGADLGAAKAAAPGAETDSHHGDGTGADRLDLGPGYEAKYAFPATVPKPVIAVLNGPAVGGGLLLALSCDLRFAADGATFSTGFARRGMVAEYSMAWLLPRLVGLSNALDLLYSARMVGADEALAMGLVDRVLPAPQLADAAGEYARRLAEDSSPRSMRVIKELVYRGLDRSLADSVAEALAAMAEARGSADYREGIEAWREGRAARFTGR